MIRLMRFLKPYWKWALLAPLLMFIEVMMDLQQPRYMSQIVDIGISRADTPFIFSTGGKMLLAAIVGALGGLGCNYYSSKTAMSFGTDIRQAVMNKVQTFSFADLDRLQTASIITRVTNDIVQMQNTVIMLLRMMVRAPMMCIGGLIMALHMNPGLSTVLVLSMPLLLSVVLLVIRKGFPLFRVIQTRMDNINAVMRENLSGMRVVKAYVRAEQEKQRFAQANERLTETFIRVARIMSVMGPAMMLILNGAIIAALYLASRQSAQAHAALQQYDVGRLMAFITYLVQILMALMMSTMMIMDFSRAKASADRINEMLDVKPDIVDGEGRQVPGRDSGSISFKDVSFRYRGAGGDAALNGLSFSIRPGQTVGVLGGTGSGKSTMVSLIPRLYDVSGGAVCVDGVDVSRYPLKTLRDRIGIVMQDTILFTGTIAENIRWGKPDADDEQVEYAARLAQAHEFITAFPDGYETWIGQRGANLSGGQKQRIAIARALIKQPSILILDDATSAVDVVTESKIQQALKRQTFAGTRIIIAQRVSSVRHADTIMVLEDGKITARGSHEQLLQNSPEYRDIYESQMGEGAAAIV